MRRLRKLATDITAPSYPYKLFPEILKWTSILISRSRFSIDQIRSSLIVWLPINVRLFIGIQKLLLVLAKKGRGFFIELLKYVPCLLVSKQFSLNGLKVFFHFYYSKALSALQYYSIHRLFNGNYCCKKFCWKASLTISRLFSPKIANNSGKTDSLTGAYF